MKQLAFVLAAFLCCCLPSLAFTASSAPGGVYLSHAVTDLLIDVKNKKNKHNGDNNDSALSDCTIQESGASGGCTAPSKWVCEKMNSGKQCCGCVADPNAKPKAVQVPAAQGGVCCTARYPDGTTEKSCKNTQAEAIKALSAKRPFTDADC